MAIAFGRGVCAVWKVVVTYFAKKNEQSEEHKTVKDHCQTESFFPAAVDGCKCTEHWSGKSGKPSVA